MKAICKGTLSFELINIDIELISKTPSNISYKFLHKNCLNPINPFWLFCSHCNYKAQLTEIAKGLKVQNEESYFIITELDEIIHKQTISYLNEIKIIDFLDNTLLEPHLYIDYYYAFPQNLLNDSYFLLSIFLQKHNRSAIGSFRIDDINYFVCIQPHSEGLSFNTLNQSYYEYQLKNYMIEFGSGK